MLCHLTARAFAAKSQLANLAKWGIMTEIVNMHQAKSSLSRLVERALAGEEVLIARNGRPLVQLVPVQKQRQPRVPGRGKGQIWISPDFEFTDEEITELFERPL
jgi:prevent-host-death family protein